MDAERADPALKPDQRVSAELLSVWVGGHGAAALQLRLIFFFLFFSADRCFQGVAGPSEAAGCWESSQLFISQHPEIRNQMLQMFFLFVRKRFWFQSRMIRFRDGF